jgi:hypothetical protein
LLHVVKGTVAQDFRPSVFFINQSRIWYPDPDSGSLFSSSDLRIRFLPEPIPDPETFLDPELGPDLELGPDPELGLDLKLGPDPEPVLGLGPDPVP